MRAAGLVVPGGRDLGQEAGEASQGRRETVEGLKRRTFCIDRMYSSSSGRRAASG